MVELPLDRRKIVEDVGMIELKIVQDRGAGTVMDELGALVEEGGVVLVRLDDEEGGAASGRAETGKSCGTPPIRKPGAWPARSRIQASIAEVGGLAMGAGNRQHPLVLENVLGQPLRAGHVALAAVEDRLHQRVAARDHVADHPEVGSQRELSAP